MHENIRKRKYCKLGLKSTKSTFQTKNTSLIKKAPCLNPSCIWTNSKSSDESMNHNKVTANLKPQTALFILDKPPWKNRVEAHKKAGKLSPAGKILSIGRKNLHR